MDAIASQITSLTIVYSTVYWDADQRKHQSPASLAFDDVIMQMMALLTPKAFNKKFPWEWLANDKANPIQTFTTKAPVTP